MTAQILVTVIALLYFVPIVSSNPALKKDPVLTSDAPLKETRVISEHLERPEKLEEDLEKRAARDDWKRAGQGSYISTLENALGSMQRPRFGKRFPYEEMVDDGPFYNEKRARTLMEMESALSSLQRPRFGRSADAKSRFSRR